MKLINLGTQNKFMACFFSFSSGQNWSPKRQVGFPAVFDMVVFLCQIRTCQSKWLFLFVNLYMNVAY